MIGLYINLHSSKNQPKDELIQNLKDFDTIGGCSERILGTNCITMPFGRKLKRNYFDYLQSLPVLFVNHISRLVHC